MVSRAFIFFIKRCIRYLLIYPNLPLIFLTSIYVIYKELYHNRHLINSVEDLKKEDHHIGKKNLSVYPNHLIYFVAIMFWIWATPIIYKYLF